MFVKLLLRACGSSKFVIDRFYGETITSIGEKRSLGHRLHGLNVQQSCSAENLEKLSSVFLRYYANALSPEKVATNYRYTLNGTLSAKGVPVSLAKWCSEVVINSRQESYFLSLLSKIDPNFPQTFVQFDMWSWQLLFGFPRLFSTTMHHAKDQIIEALRLYFDAPAYQKIDASGVSQLLEQEMEQLGFTSKEKATLTMLQYWG